MGVIARIAVCQNPAGDGQYVPAEDTGDERCFMPACGCTPVIYAREDHLRGAVEDARDAGEASMQAAFWRARAIELGASEDEYRKAHPLGGQL